MPKANSPHSTVILKRKRPMNIWERAGLACDSGNPKAELKPGSNNCVPREMIAAWRRVDPTLRVTFVPQFNTYIFE